MSAATQALKVVIVVILVGAVTKTVRGKKEAPESGQSGGQSVDPVTASPIDPRTDGGQKPKPIRTGKEN